MTQILYTPVGDFVTPIDFWDQPSDPQTDGTKPDPVSVLTGIYSKLESLWTTTGARRLSQQVLTTTSHRITIRYTPGLRSRMFIIYNDPDVAVDSTKPAWQQGRRFDIDSINDPDAKKVELQILAIERNDGR